MTFLRFFLISSFFLCSNLVFFEKQFLGAQSLSDEIFFLEELELIVPERPIHQGHYFNLLFDVKASSLQEVTVFGYEELEFATNWVKPIIGWKNFRERIVRVKIPYRANKTGYFYVGGFTVKTDEREYLLSKENIEVGISTRNGIKVPVSFQWVFDDKIHYQNEVFPVTLEVVDSPSMYLRNVSFKIDSRFNNYPFEHEEISVAPNFRSREVGSQTLYSYPVLSFLVSFSSAGELYFPSGKCFFDGGNGIASALGVQISSFGVDSSGKDILGTVYEFNHALDLAKIQKNDHAVLSISISGIGNFNKLYDIRPTGEGLVFSNPTHIKNFVPCKEGYEVFQSFSWEVTADQLGKYEVVVPEFKWIDLNSKQERVLKGGRYSLEVLEAKVFDSIQDPLDKFKIASLEAVLDGETNPLYIHFGNYFLLLPALILYLIAFFLFLVKNKNRKKLLLVSSSLIFLFFFSSSTFAFEQSTQRGIDFFDSMKYEESKKIFDELLEMSPQNSALYYNVALVSYYLGLPGDAIYYSRLAVYYDTMNETYRDLSGILEEQYGLIYQYPLIPFFSPDFFFILVLVFLNLSGLLFLVLILSKRKKSLIVVFSVSVLLSTLVCSGFGITLYTRTQLPAVVVVENQSILSINLDNANPIFDLPLGTTVQITGQHEDFYIVKTSMNFEGWIRKTSLRLP